LTEATPKYKNVMFLDLTVSNR